MSTSGNLLAQEVDILRDGSIFLEYGVHHLDVVFQTRTARFVELKSAAGRSVAVRRRAPRLSRRFALFDAGGGGAGLRLGFQHRAGVQIHFHYFDITERALE